MCCDHGNNRSVNFAHRLRYWNNDVLTVGLTSNAKDTIAMLANWADVIITTAKHQGLPSDFQSKARLLDVGADTYPRPFNKELDTKVKKLLEDNKDWLKG